MKQKRVKRKLHERDLLKLQQSGLPAFPCKKISEIQMEFYCPYCATTHRHAFEDRPFELSHRGAHCGGTNVYSHSTGWVRINGLWDGGYFVFYDPTE